VHAIDLAEELIEIARDRVPGASFQIMNATELRFDDGAFDAVLFSFNGIDSVYPKQKRCKVFTEVKRVLTSGGIFMFSSHNAVGQFGRDGLLNRSGRRRLFRMASQQFGNWRLIQGYVAFPTGAQRQLFYA